MLERAKRWARAIKRDTHAVYLASRDPRVPWHAKALAIAVAAYALSPIDLIPDFIPVIGYLDDLVIVPVGIMVVVRMIPPEVMAEHRIAAELAAHKPSSRTGLVIILSIWLLILAVMTWLILPAAIRWASPG
jgi:uncharacterized membrane protein YkvA (DUF1232 family)